MKGACIGLLLAATTLAGCGGEERRVRPALNEQPLGILNRVTVLQADVLQIDGKRYRLANAFAPEQVPAARCWAEAAAAKASIAATRQMVRNARTLSVRPAGPMDAQTRIPAIVQFDGLDVGEALVQQGLAARDGTRRFGWCEPISKSDPRAPPLPSLFDLGR